MISRKVIAATVLGTMLAGSTVMAAPNDDELMIRPYSRTSIDLSEMKNPNSAFVSAKEAQTATASVPTPSVPEASKPAAVSAITDINVSTSTSNTSPTAKPQVPLQSTDTTKNTKTVATTTAAEKVNDTKTTAVKEEKPKKKSGGIWGWFSRIFTTIKEAIVGKPKEEKKEIKPAAQPVEMTDNEKKQVAQLGAMPVVYGADVKPAVATTVNTAQPQTFTYGAKEADAERKAKEAEYVVQPRTSLLDQQTAAINAPENKMKLQWYQSN
ncbi:hypothetical protein [Anaeromusa acidaminophila]|uniref:hypothetical protein n=1 Tax=Anaeromusa acidaminophila TaxID=81464 RepID=UPI00036A9EC2|nr:hypothetical protein [Anaeromusa acidaminophila]